MDKYDVVIIGGGTAGCAAAYTAGKAGLRTLLIEKSQVLGGTITSGLVVPVMKSGENQINTDFYTALIAELAKLGGQITYQNNLGWFNPELTKIVLDKMMKDANVEVLFNTQVQNVEISFSNIKSISINATTLSLCNYSIHSNNTQLSPKELSVSIGARYFLDATGDCDFSKKINCEFLEDNSEFQPMSLRFMMSGVDCEKFGRWILEFDPDRDVTTAQKLGAETHFSTAYTWDSDKHWALAPLFDQAVQEGLLKNEDRNYFQVFTVAGMPGTVAFNCPRIVKNLNPNSTKDISEGLAIARANILRLSIFCKKYFPGFENSYISNISNSIGVRVSNRIRGKYVYTIEDLKSGKKFDNPVLISSYPVDVHNRSKNASLCENTGEYQLPIESLMSYNYDNLFIAGRGVSADYLAQGALRVQASCFSMGEAVSKYIAKII